MMEFLLRPLTKLCIISKPPHCYHCCMQERWLQQKEAAAHLLRGGQSADEALHCVEALLVAVVAAAVVLQRLHRCQPAAQRALQWESRMRC